MGTFFPFRYFLAFVVLVSFAFANKEVIPGRVVGVTDGDTITVLTETKQSVKVRLYGIDAPESKQPFGSRAKEELSSLLFGKDVQVQVIDKDQYGRTVGRVLIGKTVVNQEMVQRGFAWWYRAYAKADKELAAAESSAREAKRGLWVDKEPVPPWEWRRNEAANRKSPK